MSKELIPCRYCKHDVEHGVKRCSHCGTHNPTMNVKMALLWTVGTIGIFYVIWFVSQQF